MYLIVSRVRWVPAARCKEMSPMVESPLSIKRFFGQNVSKRACMLLALLLCFYLGGLLPLHHHDDGLEHSDCALCMAQNQPVEVAVIFFIAIFLLSWTELNDAHARPNVLRRTQSYHSRAPPVSTPTF